MSAPASLRIQPRDLDHANKPLRRGGGVTGRERSNPGVDSATRIGMWLIATAKSCRTTSFNSPSRALRPSLSVSGRSKSMRAVPSSFICAPVTKAPRILEIPARSRCEGRCAAHASSAETAHLLPRERAGHLDIISQLDPKMGTLFGEPRDARLAILPMQNAAVRQLSAAARIEWVL